MDTYGEIKRKLRNIAAGKALIYEGEVKSVSGSTCTVDIGGVELADVRLTALPGETDILITPKVGSHVVLADLEGGTLRELVIVKYGEVEQIQLNGGQNDGLVKIRKLEENLDKLKNYCETLKSAVATGLTGVGEQTTNTVPSGSAGATAFNAAMSGQTINFSNMEDTKITH